MLIYLFITVIVGFVTGGITTFLWIENSPNGRKMLKEKLAAAEVAADKAYAEASKVVKKVKG